MRPLARDISDEDLLAVIDEWAGLMEAEDYTAAFEFTRQRPDMGWTAETYREVIKAYGDCLPSQHVTVRGKPGDTQRKEVDRWTPDADGVMGDIWYDLNIDDELSDLTATFRLRLDGGGIVIELADIHVM